MSDVILEQAGQAFAERRYEEAVKLYGQFVSASPMDAKARYNFAASLMHAGDIEYSKREFLRSLDLGYDHLDLYLNLGICRASLGEIKEAILCFQAGLELYPDSLQLLNAICFYLTSQGMYEMALESAKRIIVRVEELSNSAASSEHVRTMANALDSVAVLYHAIFDQERARAIYESAAKLDRTIESRSD